MQASTRRVVLDALAARYGGTAWAAVYIARELARDPSVEEVVVATRTSSIVANGLRGAAGLRLVELRADGPVELLRRLSWEAIALHRLLDRRPSSLLTFSGMLPRRMSARVTCYISNPVMFQRGDWINRVRRSAVRRTARGATSIVAPSHWMAKLAQPTTHVPIDVVPLGVDHDRFFPSADVGDRIVCVGDFYGHKRHDLVLDAWAALPGPRPDLQMIGDPLVDLANYRQVIARADRYRRLGSITFCTRLRLKEMLAAYQGARVLVNASEYESFSMPLLEAQACGVPAIVRDIPALRETGGDGTTYVSGSAADVWAAAMRSLLDDRRAHAGARRRSLIHASGYSWTRTANELKRHLFG